MFPKEIPERFDKVLPEESKGEKNIPEESVRYENLMIHVRADALERPVESYELR